MKTDVSEHIEMLPFNKTRKHAEPWFYSIEHNRALKIGTKAHQESAMSC